MNTPSSKKYVFLHIPKTAGYSLFSLYTQVLGPDNVRNIVDNSIGVHNVTLLDDFPLIGGHFTYSLINDFFSDRYKITFLRHPVDRFISQYAYAKHNVSSLPIFRIMLAKEKDLEDYVNYCRSRPNMYDLLNTQTWYLSGNLDPALDKTQRLELAKKNLASFDFIGIQEFFSDSINLLCYDCNWPPIYDIPLENKAVKRKAVTEVDPRFLDQIREMNLLDLELYEYGLALFRQKKKQLLLECVRRNYHSVVSSDSPGEFSWPRG
ncbi:MAG: sulfotransferase family 2 domain-containing protein, partial [Deltaproteobacteria bacterium]|nr:sulfotransferase family 2 domain-containing protein [Deltaproteobacteria bacterium]